MEWILWKHGHHVEIYNGLWCSKENKMKLQVAIVHYFNPEGGGNHGSLSPNAEPRCAALRSTILQLHRLFGARAASLNHLEKRLDCINDGGGALQIKVCVTEDKHLLNELEDLRMAGAFEIAECHPRTPKELGFECHRILQESHEEWEYSAYLEDDIVIHDADFLLKLRHFNKCFGNQYLLQPNRIETTEDLKHLHRFYIDGDYNPASTAIYRQSMAHKLSLSHLGENINFEQPLNTHSGCFFLNQSQANSYFKTPFWHDKDISFHGPLESAATLGVMKHFQIMKPSAENAQFLTVEHAGRNFMGLVAIAER